MTQELDFRGLQCPEPVARCRNLLQSAQPGNFSALVDNAAALENVSRFLQGRGYETQAQLIGDNAWRISASRAGAANENEMETATRDSYADKTLIFLTSAILGQGDDGLGAKLMSTFLANLSELGSSLWRIILLNGAVKLSASEGEALKHLKALEAAGVSILVCGTCLMHYGLLEKKQVGETTNMLDVVSSLALAKKIIRP